MNRTCGIICPTDNSMTADTWIRASITAELKHLITQNHITRFLCGMNLGGDLLCAELVLELKSSYPFITLESVFPYENQAEYWSEEQRDRYYDIASQCDRETLLQYHYDEQCIERHKRYIVEMSDIILTVSQTAQADNLQQFNKAVIRITASNNVQ